MCRSLFMLVIFVAGLCSGRSSLAFQQPSTTDGIWHPVTAVLAGQEFPKAVNDSIVLKLTGDRYEVRVNGTPDKGTCGVDRTTDPHRMTITGTEGPNKGKTLLAIFEVTAADTMRVCYDLTGKAFPAEFRSAGDTGHYR